MTFEPGSGRKQVISSRIAAFFCGRQEVAPLDLSELSGQYMELSAFCAKGKAREAKCGNAEDEQVLIEELLADSLRVREHLKCCHRCADAVARARSLYHNYQSGGIVEPVEISPDRFVFLAEASRQRMKQQEVDAQQAESKGNTHTL